MKKGICFFDLDGTLLDNRLDIIPEGTLDALARLRSNYYVVISTGRDMDTHYSVKYASIISPDAIIHLNGSKITAGGELVFRHYIDEELLKKIYDFSMQYDICFGTTIGDCDYYTVPWKKERSDRAYTDSIHRNFVPFTQLFEKHIPVTALSYAGDIGKDSRLIKEHFPTLTLYTFNGGAGADVVEDGFSKAMGMKRLCDHYGIDQTDTYAFGDSPNDIPIIRAAGTGVAMGNAEQSVKDAADLVTDDIRHDGIRKACISLGLI